MKNCYTRRRFLHQAAASLGALTGGWLLTACSGEGHPPAIDVTETGRPATATARPTDVATLIPSPSATQAPGETAMPTPSPTPDPTASPVPRPSLSHPDVVVARGGAPEALARQALAALGGMERFVSAGDDVIVKPNICVAYHSYEYAATTNPWVVGALVKLALEAGAGRVRVMDYPFGGSAEQAYVNSGIQAEVEKAGGEMEAMTRFKFVDVEIPAGVDLGRCLIYDDVVRADVVINVPIAKHHSLARLTLGMKNLMGVIYDRPAMHGNLGQRLADLASRVEPTLTVVDAVRILMDHGPTGGSLDDVKQADTLIASPDIVAADSYAATLFGLQPNELAYVRAGAAMELGRSDLNNLKIEEVVVAG